MTTQTHVCSVAGCPQPVTLMTSLNGNPLRAYCATHVPVVYTQAAPPALPDATALRAVLVDLVNACLLWDSDEDGYEWADVMAVVSNAENVLAARAAAGGRDA